MDNKTIRRKKTVTERITETISKVSVLCQQEPYFMELVRYIHLNPLRAGIVKDLRQLDRYPYAGHSALMGKCVYDFQDSVT